LYIVVWPGKLLADSYFFIFFIYFNKTYIKILCYNNHAHTSLNQSSDNFTPACLTVLQLNFYRCEISLHGYVMLHYLCVLYMMSYAQWYSTAGVVICNFKQ